jgi:hypothetical protein
MARILLTGPFPAEASKDNTSARVGVARVIVALLMSGSTATQTALFAV